MGNQDIWLGIVWSQEERGNQERGAVTMISAVTDVVTRATWLETALIWMKARVCAIRVMNQGTSQKTVRRSLKAKVPFLANATSAIHAGTLPHFVPMTLTKK